MGKDNQSLKAPDYTPQQNSAKQLTDAARKASRSAQRTADEQLSYFRARTGADDATVKKANAGLFSSAAFNDEASRDFMERYVNVFQPLEDDLIQEYQDYATPGRYELNRGRAMADVGAQFDAARKNSQRQLESYGIDPSATRYAALDIGVRTSEAAAKAAAANQADLQTDEERRALRAQGIELGLQYPGFSDTTSDNANAARSAAVDNTLSATRTAADVQGTAPQYDALGASYLNAGTAANRSGADIAARSYDQRLAADRQAQESGSGWGDVLGLAAGVGTKVALGSNPATAPFAFAEGGAIPHPGMVYDEMSPSGGEAVDDVNARLNAGEFVIPEETVRWYGEKHFQNVIQKAKDEKSGAKAKPKMKPAIPGPTQYASPGAIPMRG